MGVAWALSLFLSQAPPGPAYSPGGHPPATSSPPPRATVPTSGRCFQRAAGRGLGAREATAKQRGSGPGTVRTSVLGAASSLASWGEGTRAGGPLGPSLAEAGGQEGVLGCRSPRLQTVGSKGCVQPRPSPAGCPHHRPSPAGCPHPGSSHSRLPPPRVFPSSVSVLFGWVQPPGCREAWEVRQPLPIPE